MSNLLAISGFGIGLIIESFILLIVLILLLIVCVRKPKEKAEECEEEPAEKPAESSVAVVADDNDDDEDPEVERRVRSFYAKLVQCSDDTKAYYSELKNELLRYKKCHSRLSWKRETFRVGRQVVARMAIRGKTLCLYLALNPADFEESKYHLEDVSELSSETDTPALYRLRSDRAERYGKELIAAIFEKMGIERQDLPEQDYRPADATEEELLQAGYIKIRMVAQTPEEVFADLNSTSDEKDEEAASTETSK